MCVCVCVDGWECGYVRVGTCLLGYVIYKYIYIYIFTYIYIYVCINVYRSISEYMYEFVCV